METSELTAVTISGQLLKEGEQLIAGSFNPVALSDQNFVLRTEIRQIDWCVPNPAASGLCEQPDQVVITVRLNETEECTRSFLFDVAEQVLVAEDECHSILAISTPISIFPCESVPP